MAVLASAVWRVRTGGSNVNGGGYDPGIAGAATDYSQQDAAQASGTLGTAAGTAAFSDAGGAFTAAMIGNALWIASGAGFTVGAYFITAFTSATAVTLDRSPGTGAAAVWKLGGAWADPFINVTSTGPMVAGNTLYIRGAGSDNPGAADYTTTGNRTLVVGTNAAGRLKLIGENGRPRLQSDGLCYFSTSGAWMENLFFSNSGTSNASLGMVHCSGNLSTFVNVAFDQSGRDVSGIRLQGTMIGCEVFSSTPNAGAAGSNAGIISSSFCNIIDNCNVHECWGDGISLGGDNMNVINASVVAKCKGNGIAISGTDAGRGNYITRNTIDGNSGHGVTVSAAATLFAWACYGNLITNQNQASKYGINVAAGTTAVNDRIKTVWDFNWFYNNTADYNTISAGPHDTAGTDPLYTNQGTQDYTLQSSSPAIAKGFPAAATYALPGASPAPLTTISPLIPRRNTSPAVENYMDEGGVQRIMATGGGGMLVHPGMGGGARG